MTTETVTILVGDCDRCEGATHEAEYHHEGTFGEGAIFAVTCPEDGLTQFHTREGVTEQQVERVTAASLGLDLR